MGDLSCFLSQNAVKADREKYVASKRFLGADKKPVEWEIKAITSKDLGKLASECTVYPNLNDKALQDSYHVMGADALLKAMLTAGEYAGYLEKIQQVNGFDSTMEEQVEEAKN